MKHIYLCGPVSGRPLGEAKKHFETVERKIRRTTDDGRIEICTSNPIRICQYDLTWHQAMRICVGELARCGGIALLRGWRRSKGAMLELKLAQDLHIPVVFVEPPVDSLDLTELFTVAPEALRYYNARLTQFYREGAKESAAESRAAAELANRYLDPYGFEYISIEEGK